MKTIIDVFKRRPVNILPVSQHDVIPPSNPASSTLQIRKVNLRKFKQGACQNSNLALTPELMLFPLSHVTSQEAKMFHKEIIIELDNTAASSSRI